MYTPTFAPVHNWRNRKNKSKRYKIHIRVIINRVPKYWEIKTPQKIAESEWSDRPKAWVKNTNPYAAAINKRIDEVLGLLTDLNNRFFTARKQIQWPDVKRSLQAGSGLACFNTYYAFILTNPPEKLGEGNLKRYNSALEALNKFNPKIFFWECNEELFMRLKLYMETDLNLAGSTIRGYFNAYKKIMKWGRFDAHIFKDQQEEAFENIRHSIDMKDNDYMTVEEVRQWENYDMPEEYRKTYQHHQFMFILQCYTGYYYNDLRTLEKNDLKQDPVYGYYLHSDRYKNDQLAIVPLWKFPRAMQIIQLFLNPDPDSKLLLDPRYFISDQKYNKYLKTIAGAKMLGWTRELYNKLGRKTFAQLFIRFGGGRSQLSRVLGHNKDSTAEHYFSIGLADIIEGVKNIDFAAVNVGQTTNLVLSHVPTMLERQRNSKYVAQANNKTSKENG